MSALTLQFYGKDYTIACDDGQEEHLTFLAQSVNERIRQLGQQVGRQNEGMMLVLTCLMLADEVMDKDNEISQLKNQVHSLLENGTEGVQAELEAKLESQQHEFTALLEKMSEKLESIAAEMEEDVA